MKTCCFVFDIDGVITDGKVYILDGKRSKCLNMKDMDAIFELKRMGCIVCAVTAEKDEFVDWIRHNFPWDYISSNIQNKKEAIVEIRKNFAIEQGSLIYIGDGKKDISALLCADMRICPADAIDEVKQLCDVVLQKNAGEGGLWQLISIAKSILSQNLKPMESYLSDYMRNYISTLYQLEQEPKWKGVLVDMAESLTETMHNDGRIFIYGDEKVASYCKYFAFLCSESISEVSIEILERLNPEDKRNILLLSEKELSYRNFHIPLRFSNKQLELETILNIIVKIIK